MSDIAIDATAPTVIPAAAEIIYDKWVPTSLTQKTDTSTGISKAQIVFTKCAIDEYGVPAFSGITSILNIPNVAAASQSYPNLPIVLAALNPVLQAIGTDQGLL